MTTETCEEKMARQAARREAKEAQAEKIVAELRKMKVGSCGVKHDQLVWRISETRFAVGRNININDAGDDIEMAAVLLCD